MSAAKAGTSEWRGPAPQNVDISRKVAFLATPRVYAEQPTGVEIVETHFSWVFLTDRYVYKLKKPLRGDGFDFSTAQARRSNAEAEVRLNRRLAADIYLGVVPLTLAGGDRLAIDGKGVVDWLVKMVRLSAERMLDRRPRRRGLARCRYPRARRWPRQVLRDSPARPHPADGLSRPLPC